MNDQRRDSSAPGRLLELVGPSAVIGQRLAFEELCVVGSRIIQKQKCDFSREVGILVVIPVMFQGADPISNTRFENKSPDPERVSIRTMQTESRSNRRRCLIRRLAYLDFEGRHRHQGHNDGGH